MAEVIYYKSWHMWYKCSECEYNYGSQDPLHTHWCVCCPSCGAKTDSHAPPNIEYSRRWCCTKKVTWWEAFLGKKDLGYYEYKQVKQGSGSTGSVGVSTRVGLNNTALIGAVSIMGK